MANDATTYTTPVGRLSFPHIFTPKAWANDDAFFRCELLYTYEQKDSGELDAFREWMVEQIKKRHEGVPLSRVTFHGWVDGNTLKPEQLEKYPEKRDRWILKAKLRAEPADDGTPAEVYVHRPDGTRLRADDADAGRLIYGGANARLLVKFYGYGGGQTGNPPGFSFELGGVQVMGGGEPFGDPKKRAEERVSEEQAAAAFTPVGYTAAPAAPQPEQNDDDEAHY